ncbi:MAG: FtsX-like permease family protein [Bacteroidia bacterium]
MNFELYVAERISFRSRRTFSKLVVRIAVSAIALSVAIMIISVSIVKGFQGEITNKVIGFGSHIQVSHAKINRTFENTPIERSQEFYRKADSMPKVRHVQSFAFIPGIFRTDEAIEGVILKGVDEHYDWQFFEQKLVKGHPVRYNDSAASNDIVVSQIIADKLKLDTGDRVITYFIRRAAQVRRFTVAGIYDTGLEEIDERFVLADIGHIQQLNEWDENMIGGYEVLLHDLDDLEEVNAQIRLMVPPYQDTQTIKELFPQIFDWLNLLNINVLIMLPLLIIVASINMITALLIMILEKTQMIGVLKALGANNYSVRKIFIYNALLLSILGVVLGNILGLGLMWLQYEFQIIHLAQESYYVSEVPVIFNFLDIFLINAGTIIVCSLIMLLPSLLATRITPLKALRFE